MLSLDIRTEQGLRYSRPVLLPRILANAISPLPTGINARLYQRYSPIGLHHPSGTLYGLPSGDFGNLYGWGWLLTQPALASIGLLLHWLAPRWFGRGYRPHPLWLVIPLAGIFIDDVGTAIGCQAEETPRVAIEGNPGYTQLHYKLYDLGLSGSLTSTFRWAWLVDTLSVLLFHWAGKVTNTSLVLLTLFNFGKAWAGWNWWKLEPNDYGVWDFFTFSNKERDCWERLHWQASDIFDEEGEKGHDKVKAIRNSHGPPHGWWPFRRRLAAQPDQTTATAPLRFLFPHKSWQVTTPRTTP